MSVARVLCSSDDTKAYSMLQQCINNQPSLIHSYSNDICLNTKHPRRDDINTFRGHKSVALCVCRFGFWVAMNKPKVVILLSGKRKCGKDFLAGKLLEKCDILESVFCGTSYLTGFLLVFQIDNGYCGNRSNIRANQGTLGQWERAQFGRFAEWWTVQGDLPQGNDWVERWHSSQGAGILLFGGHQSK